VVAGAPVRARAEVGSPRARDIASASAMSAAPKASMVDRLRLRGRIIPIAMLAPEQVLDGGEGVAQHVLGGLGCVDRANPIGL
jgi:hypothetical protein